MSGGLMGERTQEEVIGEIHRQREELLSAMAETRREVKSELAQLKTVAERGLPILGVVVGVLVVSLVARRLSSRRKAPVAIERLRIGRYSLLEHV